MTATKQFPKTQKSGQIPVQSKDKSMGHHEKIHWSTDLSIRNSIYSLWNQSMYKTPIKNWTGGIIV